jgi:hypothetical protein
VTPRTDRVVIDLVMPQPTGCAPCENAIEEIDDAVALLDHELAARGTAVQVRVTPRTDRSVPGAYGVGPRLEVRVNGDAIKPHGTQDCGDEGRAACDTFEWNEATYAAPPAELLTALVHERLDRNDRGRGGTGGSAQH